MTSFSRLAQTENSTILVMLYCIAFVGVFAVDFYLPAITTIAKEFNKDPSTIALTMSSYTFTFALGQLIVGPISDYCGRKLTFEIGLLVSILGTFSCMISSNFWELLIARGIQGFGLSCFVLINAIIRDAFPDEVAVKIRISRSLVSYFLIAVAPAIGVIVLKASNWRMIFAIFLVLSILILTYIKFYGIETNKNINKNLNLIVTLRQFYEIVSHREFFYFSLIAALAYSVHFSFITISSNLLLNKLNLHYSIYVNCMFGYGVSFLIGAMIAMYLTKKCNMQHLLKAGGMMLIAGGLSLISFFLPGEISLLSLIISVILCVIGISFISPSAATFALSKFESQAGSASACLGVMQFTIASLFSAVVSLGFGHSIMLIGLLAMGTGLLASFPYCCTKKRV